MTERSLESIKDIEHVNLMAPNKEKIDGFLEEEREKSRIYLETALQFKEKEEV